MYWVPVLKSLCKFILSITQEPTIWAPGLLGSVKGLRLRIGVTGVGSTLGLGVWARDVLLSLESKVEGLGFRVWVLGFRVWSLGFRVWGLGLRVLRLGIKVFQTPSSPVK